METLVQSTTNFLITENIQIYNVTTSYLCFFTRSETYGKQKKDQKVHACYFCGKLNVKIGRHLSSEKHKQDLADVDYIGKENDTKYKSLVKMGDYKHNVGVLTNSINGKLIVGRQDGVEPFKFRDLAFCCNCRKLLTRRNIYRHYIKCMKIDVKETAEEEPVYSKELCKSSDLMLYSFIGTSTNATANEFTINILNRMKVDDVSLLIRSDSIILKLGNSFFDKLGSSQRHYIACKLREIGRLVLQLRKVTQKENYYMEDF